MPWMQWLVFFRDSLTVRVFHICVIWASLSATPQQLSFVPIDEDAAQLELQDLLTIPGFKNEALQLTDADLVQNIRALQAESNIHQSDKLVAPLGRCSLDIEGDRNR